MGVGSFIMGKTLIKSTTISADTAAVEFIDGTSDVVLDDTYLVYEFHFYNIHPNASGGQAHWCWQSDVGTDTDWDQQYQSTFYRGYSPESGGGDQTAGYQNYYDIHIGQTSHTEDDYMPSGHTFHPYAALCYGLEADDAHDSTSGYLTLYDPANGTHNKKFNSRMNGSHNASENTVYCYTNGYIHQGSAITRVRFKFSNGTIDSGVIKLFGVS